MTNKIVIDTSEFKAFQKDLLKLPGNLGDKVLQGAVVSAIRPAMKEIKNAAPRSNGPRSPMSQRYGQLYTNIKVRRSRSKYRFEKSALVNTGDAFWAFINQIMGNRYQSASVNWFQEAFERAHSKMIEALGAQLYKRINAAWDKLGK